MLDFGNKNLRLGFLTANPSWLSTHPDPCWGHFCDVTKYRDVNNDVELLQDVWGKDCVVRVSIIMSSGRT